MKKYLCLRPAGFSYDEGGGRPGCPEDRMVYSHGARRWGPTFPTTGVCFRTRTPEVRFETCRNSLLLGRGGGGGKTKNEEAWRFILGGRREVVREGGRRGLLLLGRAGRINRPKATSRGATPTA